MGQKKTKYIPTNEQEKYISQEDGKIVLNACPGSGKTVTIAYKLTNLTQKYETNDFTGFACLSFTNIAKDEIQKRYREFSNKNIIFPHIVSTIDHFINTWITLPFFSCLEGGNTRPKIIDDASFLNELYGSWDRYTLKGSRKPLKYSYPPSDIEYEMSGMFSINGKFPDEKKVDPQMFQEYCKLIKDWQFEKGLLKTTDSAFIALKALKKFPQIAKYLVCRFPHIIVDEAQDTSEIQHAIFDQLIEGGLGNIEFVGDPYQALYEWRDAKPEIFYSKFKNTEYDPHIFTKCKRSSQNIVDTYCILRKTDEKKLASDAETDNLQIQVYTFAEGNEKNVVEKWESDYATFKEKQVLVRGRALRNKLLGISDSKVLPWHSEIPYKIRSALQKLNNDEIKKAVIIFRNIIPIVEGINDQHKRKERVNELKTDHLKNAQIMEMLKRCPLFNLELEKWTNQTQTLLNKCFLCEVDFRLKEGRWKSKYHTKLSDLFGISQGSVGVEVSTIHAAKGMTFDSVLLFLSRKHPKTISLDDMILENDLPNEKQRLIYVAMSRPSHLLALGIPDIFSPEVIKEKLGKDIGITPI